MARAEAATGLSLHRDGPVLRLSGVLDRAAATAAWPALLAQLPGAQVLDVAAVQRLDSAGLALLAEAADRLSAQGAAVQVTGAPEGLAELRAAYRLDAALNLDEFTKIIINCVLHYNNSHEIKSYDYDRDVKADGVPAIPCDLWE